MNDIKTLEKLTKQALPALVLGGLLLSSGVAEAQIPGLSQPETVTFVTLEGVATEIASHAEGGGYPLSGAELIPVSELDLEFPGGAGGTNDGWGNALLYWSDGVDYAIVSYGEDAMADGQYDLTARGESTDDIVWSNDDLVRCPPHITEVIVRGKQRRTMADMRSIAICFEAYKLDNGGYPDGPTNGFIPIEEFSEHFHPVYIRRLPLTDGWGNPILVWHDGVENYRIVASGADAEIEGDHEGITHPIRPTTSDADIVFVNGWFKQWPDGVAQ
ncbi:MAG: hypothetical protein GY716_22165 [bacterium]|nr:hypothetical protein [bacterium]